MATENANPFVDPAPSFELDAGRASDLAVDGTLALGRNASLTLGTDSLIVLGTHLSILNINRLTLADEAFEKRDRSNCCGFWPSGPYPAFPTFIFSNKLQALQILA